MKKLVNFSLLLLLCMTFCVGCGKKTSIKLTKEQQLIAELNAPRPPLDANKDYTNNLSGHWAWIAKDKKTKKELGKGKFIILQKDGELVGFNKVESGINSVLAKNVKVTPSTKLVLMGKRKSNSESIQFTTLNAESSIKIDSVLLLSKKGHKLMGESFSILDNSNLLEKGKFSEFVYELEATRISG